MTFTVNDAYLPATLTAPNMSDEEFAEFCAQYPDYFIEMTAEGKILIMPPNYSLTGSQNSRINRQLEAWAETDDRGITTDSSSGFPLPNGARRSPDAAWTLRTRIADLPTRDQEAYWHLAPDFVIELKSKTDRLPTLRRKMNEWIANGVELGWLIDPDRKAVEVYRQGRKSEVYIDIDRIAADGPVAGFLLDLARVWNPLL